jgi:hypothetical protein
MGVPLHIEAKAIHQRNPNASLSELAWSLSFCSYMRSGTLPSPRALTKALETELKFNPDQPRVPAGNPDGGQWLSDGVDGAVATAEDFAALEDIADITGFTRHGLNQAINRGISPDAILDAVKNPLDIVDRPNGTTQFWGRSAVVVLNPAGQVVTVWGQ